MIAEVMEWVKDILLVVVGALLAWGIAHVYYKKSKQDLEDGLAQHLEITRQLHVRQLEAAGAAAQAAAADLRDRRLQDALVEHRKSGNSQRLIDSYADYTQQQKAQLWEAAGKLIRGPQGFKTKPFGDPPAL